MATARPPSRDRVAGGYDRGGVYGEIITGDIDAAAPTETSRSFAARSGDRGAVDGEAPAIDSKAVSVISALGENCTAADLQRAVSGDGDGSVIS